jgi:hypothetical protein
MQMQMQMQMQHNSTSTMMYCKENGGGMDQLVECILDF